MLQSLKNILHALEAFLAVLYYRYPASKMKVIAITGTSGKTTTSEILYHILKSAGKNVSMISTIRAVIGAKVYDTGFHVTTPNPFNLQKYLRKAKDANTEYMILEVTSHALDQNRVLGTSIDIGVVLNVTHEHLDYHGSFKKYLEVKSEVYKGASVSVLNMDDANFEELKKRTSGKLITFGIKNTAHITKRNFPFETKLLGVFNEYNVLAAVAVAKEVGIDSEVIRKAISSFLVVSGRMEEVKAKRDFRIFVDFAHKPDALENALKTARVLTKEKLIVIFGSAGLRDTLKRPMMGKIAAGLADRIILTAEDPRTEDVRDIIGQIAQGILEVGGKETKKTGDIAGINANPRVLFWKIPDRQEAINFAVRKLAQPGDLVLCCGKSHEKSICYGKTEYPWDEFLAIEKALNNKK